MMTLEEALELWDKDATNLLARHQSMFQDFGRNPDILQTTIAIRDSKSPCEGIILALKIGIILGIEMEKVR